MTGGCTLYRYFDRYDHLLYVGITGSGSGRMHSHSSNSRWWRKVHHATFTHYRTRELAAAAEVLAIRTELPRYNLMHKAWGTRPLHEIYAMLDALPPVAVMMPSTELAHILNITNVGVRGACRAGFFEHRVIGRIYLIRIEHLRQDIAWFVEAKGALRFIYP